MADKVLGNPGLACHPDRCLPFHFMQLAHHSCFPYVLQHITPLCVFWIIHGKVILLKIPLTTLSVWESTFLSTLTSVKPFPDFHFFCFIAPVSYLTRPSHTSVYISQHSLITCMPLKINCNLSSKFSSRPMSHSISRISE